MDPKKLILVNTHYALVDSEDYVYYISTSKKECEERLDRYYRSLENGDYTFRVIELDNRMDARVVGCVAEHIERDTEFLHQEQPGNIPVQVVVKCDATNIPKKVIKLWASQTAVKLKYRERFMTSDDYVVVLNYSTTTAEVWKAGERSTTLKEVPFEFIHM